MCWCQLWLAFPASVGQAVQEVTLPQYNEVTEGRGPAERHRHLALWGEGNPPSQHILSGWLLMGPTRRMVFKAPILTSLWLHPTQGPMYLVLPLLPSGPLAPRTQNPETVLL